MAPETAPRRRTLPYAPSPSVEVSVRTRVVFGASVAVLALLLASCAGQDESAGSSPAPTRAAVERVSVDTFATFLDDPDVTVLNVHVPYEGELPGTDAFVPYDQVVGSPALPDDRDAPIAVYCMSGSMSAQAARALADEGFTDIRDLAGGMLAWQQAGRELILEEAPTDSG